MQFFKKVFDFFIFSSLFIALCSVLMVMQTNDLLHLNYKKTAYIFFVFFSTICSYNFHWYLTPNAVSENDRSAWTQKHRVFHMILFAIGVIGSAYFFFAFIDNWFWMLAPVILTFLYSAPKIPHPFFNILKKVAIGKTLFLSFVWMYVTALLPAILDAGVLTKASILFCLSRFFLIYAICILFDYRDREDDRREGIRSMITYFSEAGVNALFFISIALFTVTTIALYYFNFSITVVAFLLLPGIIVALIFKRSKTDFSDYLYYFVLDGLMMLSSLLTLFIRHS